MDAIPSVSPELRALLERSHDAVRESRVLITALQDQRRRARRELDRLNCIGSEFQHSTRILYPGDTTDPRLSGTAARDRGSTARQP